MGKGACITRIGAVRNYSTSTIMEKKNKQRWGEGGEVKNMKFVRVLKKQ